MAAASQAVSSSLLRVLTRTHLSPLTSTKPSNARAALGAARLFAHALAQSQRPSERIATRAVPTALHASVPDESRKAYCAKLADVTIKYLTVGELAELAQVLEGFARNIAARRYCPGLNDATYDMYARFALLRKGA